MHIFLMVNHHTPHDKRLVTKLAHVVPVMLCHVLLQVAVFIKLLKADSTAELEALKLVRDHEIPDMRMNRLVVFQLEMFDQVFQAVDAVVANGALQVGDVQMDAVP